MNFSAKKARLIAAAGYSARYAALFLIAVKRDGDLESWHDLIALDLYSYGRTLTDDFPETADALCARFDDPKELMKYFDQLHERNGLVDERDLFNFSGILCFYFEGILRDDEPPDGGYLGEALARMDDHFGPKKLEQIRQLIISEGRRVAGTGMHNILPKVRSGIMNIVIGVTAMAEGGGAALGFPLLVGRRDVFVVHGHDEIAKLEVARLLERLDLNPIILHEQPNEGRTIIEKFEFYSDVAYAIVILTPDDMGYLGGHANAVRPRARQNVVFELGYFVGRLGRRHVCALYKEGVEIPSDLHGVLYIPMESQGAWKLSIVKEMKQVGMEVDLNLVVS